MNRSFPALQGLCEDISPFPALKTKNGRFRVIPNHWGRSQSPIEGLSSGT